MFIYGIHHCQFLDIDKQAALDDFSSILLKGIFVFFVVAHKDLGVAVDPAPP